MQSAIQNGNLEELKKIIAEDNSNLEGDPTYINEETSERIWSPLLFAVWYDKPEIVHHLLFELGANPNRTLADGSESTPVFYAAEQGKNECLNHLVKAKGNVDKERITEGSTPLIIAIQGGFFETVKIIVEAGGNISKARYDGVSPVWKCAEQDQLEIMSYLIERKADLTAVNVNGNGVLHAVKSGDAVHILVDGGAVIDASDIGGFSALCRHSFYGADRAVDALLEKGASTQIVGWNGNSALHLAAGQGKLSTVRKLLATSSANLNSPNVYGYSPLLLSAQKGSVDVLKELVQSGADIHVQDKHGNTALHHAIINGHKEMTKYLVEQPTINLHTSNDIGTTQAMLMETIFPDVFENLIFPVKSDSIKHRPQFESYASRFAITAQAHIPMVSLSNVMLIPASCFLENGEFPEYSYCEQQGWHVTGEVVKIGQKVLFVSHRWGSVQHPDPDGSQFEIAKQYMETSPQTYEYVWLDYACICQVKPSDLFNAHLVNIPTSLWVATDCLIIPKLDEVKILNTEETTLVSHLKDYLGRAWCVLEAVSCLLTSTKMVCALKMDASLEFCAFERPEGACTDMGFYMAYVTTLWKLLGEQKFEPRLRQEHVRVMWDIQEPCRILVLLKTIFSPAYPHTELVAKSKDMTFEMEDIRGASSPSEVKELWGLLGVCAMGDDEKLIVFRFLLFIAEVSFSEMPLMTAHEEQSSSSIHVATAENDSVQPAPIEPSSVSKPPDQEGIQSRHASDAPNQEQKATQASCCTIW